MPGFIGVWELAALAVVLLLLFGPKRLPEVGRSMGKGVREFKDSLTAMTEPDVEVDHPDDGAPAQSETSSRRPHPRTSHPGATRTRR